MYVGLADGSIDESGTWLNKYWQRLRNAERSGRYPPALLSGRKLRPAIEYGGAGRSGAADAIADPPTNLWTAERHDPLLAFVALDKRNGEPQPG